MIPIFTDPCLTEVEWLNIKDLVDCFAWTVSWGGAAFGAFPLVSSGYEL